MSRIMRAGKSRRRWALAVPAFTLAGLTATAGTASAATGTAAESASQIVPAATAAMSGLKAVTIKGSGLDGKQPLSFDIMTSTDGDAQGSLSEQGSTISLIEVGSTGYLRANEKFYTTSGLGKTAAAKVAGHWLYGSSTTQPFSSFTAFLDLKEFLTDLDDGFTGSTFTKTGTAKVGGKPVVVVTGYDAKAKDGGRLYVAATGTPYILKEVSTGKGNTGTVTFSGFNQALTTTAPAGAVSAATYGL